MDASDADRPRSRPTDEASDRRGDGSTPGAEASAADGRAGAAEPSGVPSSRFTGDFARDFEVWAESYDTAPEIEALRENAMFESARVLFARCGSGRLAFRLAPLARRTVGIDGDRRLVALCRSRQPAQPAPLAFASADAHLLPLSEDTFDIAVDAWTLADLAAPERAIEEYRRVVDDGGTLAIIYGRTGSAVESVSCRVDGRFSHRTAVAERVLDETLGEPTVQTDIDSARTFRSLGEAVDAFAFQFEWAGDPLDDEARETVRSALCDRQGAGEDSIEMGERARLRIYRPASRPRSE